MIPICLVLCSAFLWANIGIIARFIYLYIPNPLFVVLMRVLIATFVLFISLSLFRRNALKLPFVDVLKCMFYGFWAIGANFLLYLFALRYTKIAIAATLIYTNPIFVILLSLLFFKITPTIKQIFMFLLNLLGIWLLLDIPRPSVLKENVIGVGFALGCAVTIAIYNVFGKRLVSRILPWSLLAYSHLGGSILLLGLTPLWRGMVTLRSIPPWPAWIGIIILAIGPTIVGYGLYLCAISILNPISASILAMIEPVFASILAATIFKETINTVQSVGIMLIIASAAQIRNTKTKLNY